MTPHVCRGFDRSIKNLFSANPVYEKAVENNSVSPLERIPMVPRLKAAIMAEPVLVGRERELEELMHYLDSAFDGKGTTIFVSGEAGSGKTRLAHEFLNLAKQKGVGVMAGWCLSDAAAPYFPFVEAFNTYFASFEQEEPASLQKAWSAIEPFRSRPNSERGTRSNRVAHWTKSS